ncbi:MAG: metallophosphoesterase family protein [Desulfitobacteriaceae bacterium]
MRIGVLSDTHLREGQSLPRFVWDTLTGVDLILHAGDVVRSQILADLAILAPVRAVRGNCDGLELADLPSRDLINHAGLRIGLIHGNLGIGSTPHQRALNAFKDELVDLVVFGHSHQPYLEWWNNILLFNPGSPTEKRREKRYSLGILELVNGQIEANLHYF